MLESNNVIAAVLLCCALTNPGVVRADEAPPDYYPEEYGRLNESDWPTMKDTFETVIMKKATDLGDARWTQAVFTIARISRIRWSDAKRGEVADYLLGFVHRVFEQVGGPGAEGTGSARDACRILIQRAMWCYGELKVPLDREKLAAIWSLSAKNGSTLRLELREAISHLLNQRFSDPALPALAEAFLKSNGGQIAASEREGIETALLKHKMATFGDQSQAWQHLWSVTKPDDLRRVCTRDFQFRWHGRFLAFKAVFPERDEQVPFRLAEASRDAFEKYVLLHSAALLSNGKMGAGKEVSQEFLTRLEVAADAVRQAVSAQIGGYDEEGYKDFLKDTILSMKRNAAKLPGDRDPAGEKSRSKTGPRESGVKVDPTVPPVRGVPAPAARANGDPRFDRRTPPLSRPEDRAEDFSSFSTKVVVHRLSATEDRGDARKAAQVLGDRAIEGNLELDDAEKQILEKYISSQVARAGTAATGDERQEGRAQLQRLWRLCTPRLFAGLGDRNPAVQEAAVKNLCLMRDESIVSELIARIDASKDPRFRQAGVFALGMMREKRDPLVRDRKVLDDDASKELADRLILPFLNRIEATDKDAAMQDILRNAKKSLESPFDARPKRGTEGRKSKPPVPEIAHGAAGTPSGSPRDPAATPGRIAETRRGASPYLWMALGGVGVVMVVALHWRWRTRAKVS